MKIIKRQYGGPVYSSQGIQNIGNKVVNFIDNGGIKGWLEKRKDKKLIEEFKRRNPTREEALGINPETGIKSEKPLINEDWLVASSIVPAFGGISLKSVPKHNWKFIPKTSNTRVITHNMSPEHLSEILKGKWNKNLPNPSLAVWDPKIIDNGYGDVLLLGDKSLLKKSHFYPTDAGTASVTHLGLSDIDDIKDVSAKILKHDDANVSKFRISENDLLQKELGENLFPYAEVKRSVPTHISEFKHAFVPNNLDLHVLLDANNIPYSVIDYGDEAMQSAVLKYIEQHPEIILKKGGVLPEYLKYYNFNPRH